MRTTSPKKKNGATVARENVESFEAYLRNTPLVEIPRSGPGPNKSVIAKACGFDRQVFRTNPKCNTLMENLCQKLSKSIPALVESARQVDDEQATAALARIDEKYLLALAEISALKKNLARYEMLDRVMVTTGKLPTGSPCPSVSRSLFDFN